jgi:hypothetical protein
MPQRFPGIAALAALVLGTPLIARAQSPAAPDPMADFYGATLHIEVPGQYEGVRYYAPDHTFRDVEEGQVVKGSWKLEGERVCVLRADLIRFCNLGPGHKVGETWKDTDPYTGNTVIFTLRPGRPTP